MPNTLLRWGFLSTARISQALIPPLRASKRNTLTTVASRSFETAQVYAHRHNIPRVLGSYDALLADPDIDIIYNPLPNHLHAEWTIRALQAGKHVLCEKPLALSVAEVDAIQAAAEASGKIVAEAFMYRHHPLTLKVKELVSGGSVGQVLLVRGAFTYALNRPGDVRMDLAMGGGSLWDVGCYPLSYTRYLLGSEPEELFGWQNINHTGIDDVFVAQARFPGQIYAQFDCGFRAPHRSFIEVVGDQGSIFVQGPFKIDKSSSLRLTQGGNRSQAIRFPGTELYLGEVEDMADVVLSGKAPRITLADSRANVSAICALLESARTGQAVRPV